MKYPCKLKFASTVMNKFKKEFHSEFTLAWIFTSKLLLRPDEYRGWGEPARLARRVTKNIISDKIQILYTF
ncbi:MAG TPA: hypothetical protein PKK00_14270 [Bacteroidales bacterium]|nr:hypothetical protein [Bacteroidales bacterium]HPS18353.1 hypothetical protein [Bacteroidales bacterium]